MSNRANVANVGRAAEVGDVAGRALPRRVRLPRLSSPDIVTYAFLLVGAVVILLPFFWMLLASFKPSVDILTYPPKLVPAALTIENYDYVLTDTRFLTFVRNSFIVAFVTICGHILSGTLVAYGFARFRFPGRNILFMFMLGTIMIPFHAYMIPRFWIMKQLGVLDSLAAVVLPYLFGGPLYIFLFRQFFMSIPNELDDAARVDGANSLQVYWHILLPLARPVVVTVAVIEFIASWNSFLEPLIYLNSQDNYTVTLGLSLFRSGFGGTIQWGPLMAATSLAVLPPLAVFFVAQRHIIGGIASAGLKG
ncbi:MAG: carbohydrate ABC transporter permease [Thermomicrobiales bacterium]